MVTRGGVRKYIRKQAKRAGRYLKKRYIKPRGGIRLGRIYRDVKMLKHVINSEKKECESLNTSQLVGQWGGVGTVSGHSIIQLNPAIPKGTGHAERVGNSVKVVGAHFKLQVRQQSAVVNPIKLKFIIFSHKTDTFTTARFNAYTAELMEPNSFNNTTFDLYSSRNKDYFRDFIIHRTQTVYVKGDTSGTGTAQLNMISRSFGIKWRRGHYFKYGPNTSNFELNGSLYCLVLADFGNVGTAIATDGQPANTGLTYNLLSQFYYYDN